jgi:hypothetical protein
MNQVDSKKNNDFAFPIMTFKVRFYCYRNELPLGPLGFFQELLVRADFKEMLTVLWFAAKINEVKNLNSHHPHQPATGISVSFGKGRYREY